MARLARDLHPVAWWLWAIGLAAYAAQARNPWILLLLVGVAAVVVTARRSDQPWAAAWRLYLLVAAVIVVTRVLFRIVFGGGFSMPTDTVLLDLPQIPLPDWVLGIRLLGPLTRETLLAGLYDGLQLGTIVVCIGAANALANPKRLLRSLPPALYEIGTALVVAVTVVPQLADSVRRVRAAQRLRAGDTRRVGRLRRFLVPVLEDALERSLALAAGMDARGYGRSGTASRAERRRTGALLLAGLVGVCVGVYAVLDSTAPRVLAAPMLLVGVAVAAIGLVSAGRRVARSVYRPDPWRWHESAVAASGLAAGVAGWWLDRQSPLVAYPLVTESPQLTVLALVGVLVGLAPAVVAPEPRLRAGGGVRTGARPTEVAA